MLKINCAIKGYCITTKKKNIRESCLECLIVTSTNNFVRGFRRAPLPCPNKWTGKAIIKKWKISFVCTALKRIFHFVI